jgi:hypothetical protein
MFGVSNSDKNNKIIYDINIFNYQHNVKIKNNHFIGKGSYGNVYYIGQVNDINSIIKISPSNNTNNAYDQDFYFFNKYHNSNVSEKNIGLPFLIDHGKTINKIDNKPYDYIILEYVGIKNLFHILATKISHTEEIVLFQIIFMCLYQHLLSFHLSSLVYRDVSPSNMVLSDVVTSFLMDNRSLLHSEINNCHSHLKETIYRKTSLKNICEEYINKLYGNIVKFVDGGLFGDIDYINNTEQYEHNNCYLQGDFYEFDKVDGMFGCTMRYVSPFCIFNFSSLIKQYNNIELSKNIRNLVKNMLFLADFWSLCIVYTTHLHDTNKPINIYNSIISMKLQKLQYFEYKNTKSTSCFERTFKDIPFKVEKINNYYQIRLVNELDNILNKETELIYNGYYNLRNTVSQILNAIISFVNLILLKTKKNEFKHEVTPDEDTINELYQKSEDVLHIVKCAFDTFNNTLQNNIIDHFQNE